jgi:hypothetical protein
MRKLIDWEMDIRVFLNDAFTTSEPADHVKSLIHILETGDLNEEPYSLKFYRCYTAISDFLDNLIHTLAVYESATPISEATEIIERICLGFGHVVGQLQHRHDNRPPFAIIADEYDVQDLVHALLRIFFDDVRAEEYTPSYAGGSARIDFLLKKEQILIETKKTRAKLRAKELGEELIIDIARYASHPDCKTLYCLVYDPGYHVTNPAGVENDLSRTEPFPVRVFITPKP